jgi:DNA polymerase II small subunit
MEQIPEYIEIFIIPGNHDAVRRAQPQPKIPKELINLNGRVHLLGDPAWVTIEKYLHLLYHGDALDSVIASLPGLDYKQPEKAMVELLKRRHLSPIYGTNPIVPETTDYLVIDEVPEVVCMGHLHKNGVSKYRNVFNINAGTFQLKTEYQAKFGHVPTPGIATLFNMDSLNISHVKFYEGEV